MISKNQFKRAMLYLQQEFIQHLPSYVDVELTSYNTIELTGDFDTIYVELSEDDDGDIKLRYRTSFENGRLTTIGTDSTLPEFEKYPLEDQGVFHELLDLLNQQRGLRIYHNWLLSHEFKHHPPKFRDFKQNLEYTKTVDGLDVKVVLSSHLDPDDQSTAAVYTQPSILANTHHFHGWSKNEFYPRSVNRLESAINNAIEEHQHRLTINRGGRSKRTFL